MVFTGDWIPDNELVRSAGLDLDPGSRAPLVDTALRTSGPGVFAVGNLVHPVETADIAALDGRHVAEQVAGWLGGARPAPVSVRVRAEQPLRWVSPGVLRPGDPAPARGRLTLWTNELIRRPRVTVTQLDREIAGARVPWVASPGRALHVPSRLLDAVDFAAGDVTIGVHG